jgi:protein-disulfide isomerase
MLSYERKGETVKHKLFLAMFLLSLAIAGGAGLAGAQVTSESNAAKPAARPAAIVDGKVISEADLEATIGGRLMSLKSQEYTLKRQALEAAIDKILLEKEAARQGLTVEQLTHKEIDSKIRPATEEQVKAVYESTKDKYGDRSEAEIMQQIATNLKQARINLRRSDFLKGLRSAAQVRILLDAPRVNVNAQDARARGPQNAPVTIVEFADFQCPFCNRTTETIKQLEKKYPGQIRVVFRDFPLAFHENAAKAAEAGSCAQEQGKFWQMHDKLFANQASLKPAALKNYASEIGLDAAQFNQCLDSEKYTRKWQSDRDEGESYGINGTPTFFVNGRMLAGAAPFETFVQMIDEEIERADASRGSTSSAVAIAARSLKQ